MRAYDEIKVVAVPDDAEEAEAKLDGIALEGWKLVAVDGGRAFFRRRQPAVSITAEKLRQVLELSQPGPVEQRPG